MRIVGSLWLSSGLLLVFHKYLLVHQAPLFRFRKKKHDNNFSFPFGSSKVCCEIAGLLQRNGRMEVVGSLYLKVTTSALDGVEGYSLGFPTLGRQAVHSWWCMK